MSTHIPILKSEWVGQPIDTFPLLQWLGSNNAGDVFLTQLPSGARAALHLRAADPATAQDQLRNWQLAIELDHPHLLKSFACGRTYVEGLDHLYLVTEFPEEALSEILPERALTAEETREMLAPVLDALAYLHQRELLHGDLNPEAVLVAEERLKLSTLSIRPVGSLRGFDEVLRIYDAPESKAEPLSPAADLWSLGVTLVEALSQNPPVWMRGSDSAPLIPVAIPRELAEIARKCLRVDPAQRCTLNDIQALIAVPAVDPVSAPAAPPARAQADPATDPEQFALFEMTPEPAGKSSAPTATGPESSPFSRTMRNLDDDDEPHMPPRQYIRAAIASVVVLVLLLAGWAAYRHKATAADTAAQTASAAKPASSTPRSVEPTRPRAHAPLLKGEVIDRVMPEIPARASRGIRGKVEAKIRASVDHTGRVVNASVQSAGRSRYFGERAAEAARKWRFKPAHVDGRPISSVWELRFEFRKNGTTASAIEVTP